MAWLILLGSAVLEAVWASALHASDGFRHPVPSVVFLVAATASLIGLGRAMRTIPTGTAYAVWTGIGAVLTVAWSIGTGSEAATPLKLVFLAGIIGCVGGLKLLDGSPARSADLRDPEGQHHDADSQQHIDDDVTGPGPHPQQPGPLPQPEA